MNDTLHITPKDLVSDEDRFSRFRLIGWWDQSRLSNARVLVIGAGALGNEIIKNLALLGVGHLIIADKDRIENSNLSRSVLYRSEDSGKPKSLVAAEAAKRIYPDIKVRPIQCDVIHDLGAGVYRWADLVLGGLDNREARLSINRQCWRVGRPWIDGAIEVIQGVARVFVPDILQQNPCYECTMSQRDWDLLAHRRSCNLLTRSQMQSGRVPTTPTIASIIAGIQVQEAVKLLHGLPTLSGRGLVFAGDSTDAYQVEYQRKPDCLSHETFDRIIELPQSSDELTALQVLEQARGLLGPQAVLELNRDIARGLHCKRCDQLQDVFKSLGALSTQDAVCPNCGHAEREVMTFHTIVGNESFADRLLSNLGLPRFDILTARTHDRAIGFQVMGDAESVLGEDFMETGLDLL